MPLISLSKLRFLFVAREIKVCVLKLQRLKFFHPKDDIVICWPSVSAGFTIIHRISVSRFFPTVSVTFRVQTARHPPPLRKRWDSGSENPQRGVLTKRGCYIITGIMGGLQMYQDSPVCPFMNVFCCVIRELVINNSVAPQTSPRRFSFSLNNQLICWLHWAKAMKTKTTGVWTLNTCTKHLQRLRTDWEGLPQKTQVHLKPSHWGTTEAEPRNGTEPGQNRDRTGTANTFLDFKSQKNIHEATNALDDLIISRRLGSLLVCKLSPRGKDISSRPLVPTQGDYFWLTSLAQAQISEVRILAVPLLTSRGWLQMWVDL